jgi:hypothetical protein
MMQAITKVILAILAAFLMAVPASAGMADTIKVRMDQAFRVGETLMPSGDYNIRLLDTGSDSPVLVFETENGIRIFAAVQRVAAEPGRTEEKTEVVMLSGEQGLQVKEVRVSGQGFRYQVLAAR